MSGTDVPRVFHLVGSRGGELYEGLSVKVWGAGAFKTISTFPGFTHIIGRVHKDGTWSFPKDFSEEELAHAEQEKVTFGEALQKINDLNPTVVLPNMFCLPGLTSYRALFETLGIPLVGNSSYNLALSTNKAHAKAVVAAAGVPIPESEVLRPGDKPKMVPPFILKPCNEDNSVGITLFTGKDGQDLDKALEHAFKYDNEVLCERFIPLGRELRIAVLETDSGGLETLPCLEYFLTEESPIRKSEDKFVMANADNVNPTAPTTGGRKCPADVDDTLKAKLEHLAFTSHKAMGSRYYSLYDVRVDPDGQPYFLEACNYVSFHERSVIVSMAVAGGATHQAVFENMVKKALKQKEKESSQGVVGMKA